MTKRRQHLLARKPVLLVLAPDEYEPLAPVPKPTMSAGSAKRLITCCSQVMRIVSSGITLEPGVFVKEGRIALTVMPSLATSFARPRTKPITPILAAI
jgi:hypothetical protein